MKIKELIINNYITSFLWYSFKYIKNRIPMLAYQIYKVDTKKVVLMSFNGKNYADNPRAISEKLHEEHPDYKIVWGINNIERTKDIVPNYIKVVKYGSLSWYKELATAGFWVFNVLAPHGILKRKNQHYIQTWHGDRGFKKVVFDVSLTMDKFHKRNYFRRIVEPELCDIGIVGSLFGEKFFRSAFRYYGPLLRYGTPRNDCLINLTEDRIKRFKAKLKIDNDTKIVLFAPTFRDHLEGATQEITLDINRIIDFLEMKTSNKWLCIVRGHIGTNLVCNKKYGEKVRDLTTYEDIADLLCITDILITDYSSTAGDFALTGKPIVLYQDDIDKYINEDRSLYFNIETSPFYIAYCNDDVINILEKFDRNLAKENSQKILDFYQTYETGQASSKIVDYIYNMNKQ